jgi:hypothetical protein
MFGQYQQQVQQAQVQQPVFGAFGGSNATNHGGSIPDLIGKLQQQQPQTQQYFGGSVNSAGSAFGSSVVTGFGSSALPAAAQTTAADDVISTFEEITCPTSSEPTTVVTESPLSVSYAVEGESTIPSDGVAHQVSIAVLTFESEVTHVCCPKIEARAYLQV